MPALQRLDKALGVGPRPTAGAEGRGKVLRTYKWSQFWGKDEVTEFDEAHFSGEGIFSQSSSQGHKEYQDRLRVVHLRKEGKQKAEIATAVGRSEKFVAKWWQKEEKEIPRPWGVHEYLTKQMGKNENGVGGTSNAQMIESEASDTATWWRDVELKRKFADDPGIYDEILQNTEWKPNNARTRDFATGAYHLKYDRQGNIKWEGHQAGKYKPGLSPKMDKVLQKLFAEKGIADRTSGVITNWYPDGSAYLGSHRHDCWTALFNFGHERILTMDNTPVLMQDGDMVIFGTQRHGVPVMPEITEGRITLVIFFYPTSMQKQGMWQTISDPETMAPSKPLVTMLQDRQLGLASEHRALDNSKELLTLQQLGFARTDAEAALRASNFDIDRAAEFLLLAGKGGAEEDFLGSACPCCSLDGDGDAAVPQRAAPVGRFRRANAVAAAAVGPSCAAANDSCDVSSDSTACGSGASTSDPSCSAAGSSSGVEDSAASCDSDEALARRLQEEEESRALCGKSAPGDGGAMAADDDELAALALQYEEERLADPGLIAAQFQEYESAFTMEDAERWNGNGDLMHSPFSREHLSVEKMDKVTIYSVGHGDMFEKDFYEILQCHSIRVLYDVRQTDYRGELYSRHDRFSVSALRAQCRARGIVFKPMPIGKESAYGTLAHINTDEGRHTLVELCWQAKRKRTAFLGKEACWRDDARQVAAEELMKAGHVVEHLRTDGSLERHETGREFPDWLVREEERLKLLEKKRQAGELEKPQKSRIERSTEAIAARLARPAEEVDAMEVMRGAANQKELVVAQRKLARFQRQAEEKGALAGKVVKNTPEWILEDARKQAEWVAERKKEKEDKAASGQPSGGGSAKAVSAPSPSTPTAVPLEQLPDFDIALLEDLQELQSPDAEGSVDVERPVDSAAAASVEVDIEPPAENDPNAQVEEPKRSTWRGRRNKSNAA